MVSLRTMLPALVFCLIWSSAFVAAKFGLRSAPPLTLAAWRFLLAGAAMLAIAWARRSQWPAAPRTWAFYALLGLLNNALYLGLSFVAMRTITAGLAALLASTNPLLTALAAHFVLGERLRRRKALGLALGIGGVAYIMRHRALMHTDSVSGIVLSLIGVGMFVTATVLFKRYPPRHGLPVVNGVGVAAGGLALLPVAWIAERGQPILFDATYWLALGYLAFAVSIGATLLWFVLLRRGTASRASAYHFLNPGFGLVMGWLALDEPLFWPDLLGLIPVALGIRLVTQSEGAPPR